MSEQHFKYRLALKLGHADNGKAALSYAVFKLGQKRKLSGRGRLPVSEMDGPGEIRVITYANPADMLDPMAPDVFEARLDAVLAEVPPGYSLVRVPFDGPAYREWLAKHKKRDSHTARAEWADSLEIAQ